MCCARVGFRAGQLPNYFTDILDQNLVELSQAGGSFSYCSTPKKYCSPALPSTAVPKYRFTFIIIMQYNMYHKRPLDAQNAQPVAN